MSESFAETIGGFKGSLQQLKTSMFTNLTDPLDKLRTTFDDVKKETISFGKALRETTELQKGDINKLFAGADLETPGDIELTPETKGKKKKKPSKFFAQIGKSLKSALGPMAMLTELLSGFIEPFEPIIEIIGAFGTILGNAFMPIIQPIINLLIALIPYIQAFADGISKVLGWIMGLSWEKVRDGIVNIVTKIKEAFSWEKIKDVLGNVVTKLKEIFGWDNIKAVLDNVVTKIKEAFDWENIKTVLGNVVTKLKEAFSWENIKEVFSNFWQKFKDGIVAMGQWIWDFLTGQMVVNEKGDTFWQWVNPFD